MMTQNTSFGALFMLSSLFSTLQAYSESEKQNLRYLD